MLLHSVCWHPLVQPSCGYFSNPRPRHFIWVSAAPLLTSVTARDTAAAEQSLLRGLSPCCPGLLRCERSAGQPDRLQGGALTAVCAPSQILGGQSTMDLKIYLLLLSALEMLKSVTSLMFSLRSLWTSCGEFFLIFMASCLLSP